MDRLNIDKWALFDALGYKVCHDQVRRFHESKARIKICCAPARTTKSYSAAHDVLPDIFTPGTRGWIVGPNYTLAEKEFRYIHEALVLNRHNLGLPKPKVCLTNARSGNLFIQWNLAEGENGEKMLGSIVEGKSADNPDSLLGEAIDWVIYSEASKLPRGIRERYVRPRTITRKGRELIPTTPSPEGEWVKELWDIGQQDNDADAESFSWDYTANPLYDKSEIDYARKYYGEDSPYFREQYLGEWVFFGGLVYGAYREEIHTIDPFDIPLSWPRYRAIDFGHRDPFVTLWMAVGPHNEVYFYQEYYCREGRSIHEHANVIKSMSFGQNITLTVGDPAAKQSIEDLNFEGVSCIAANNDRTAGRMRMLEYLMPTEDGPPPYPFQNLNIELPRKKWPRYYVFKHCTELIREFKFYRWLESRGTEHEKERTEGDDHAMDTSRYILMERPAPFQMVSRPPAMSFNGIMSNIRRQKIRQGFIGG